MGDHKHPKSAEIGPFPYKQAWDLRGPALPTAVGQNSLGTTGVMVGPWCLGLREQGASGHRAPPPPRAKPELIVWADSQEGIQRVTFVRESHVNTCSDPVNASDPDPNSRSAPSYQPDSPPVHLFQGGPPGVDGSEEANWDNTSHHKYFHTRINLLALASGHGRYTRSRYIRTGAFPLLENGRCT